MRDKVWFMVLVLCGVASVAGGGLALVNRQTQPIIEQRILEQGVKPSLKVFFEGLTGRRYAVDGRRDPVVFIGHDPLMAVFEV